MTHGCTSSTVKGLRMNKALIVRAYQVELSYEGGPKSNGNWAGPSVLVYVRLAAVEIRR